MELIGPKLHGTTSFSSLTENIFPFSRPRNRLSGLERFRARHSPGFDRLALPGWVFMVRFDWSYLYPPPRVHFGL